MSYLLQLTDCGVPSNQSTWPRVSLSQTNLTCVIHNEDKCSSLESMHSSGSKQDLKASKVNVVCDISNVHGTFTSLVEKYFFKGLGSTGS